MQEYYSPGTVESSLGIHYSTLSRGKGNLAMDVLATVRSSEASYLQANSEVTKWAVPFVLC